VFAITGELQEVKVLSLLRVFGRLTIDSIRKIVEPHSEKKRKLNFFLNFSMVLKVKGPGFCFELASSQQKQSSILVSM